MPPKKFWIITIILFVGHLVIQSVFYGKTDLTDSLGQLNFGIDLFSAILIVGFFGGGLGALTALIPLRQKSFKEKFKVTFPLLSSIVLLILVVTFGYLGYLKEVKGIELRPIHKYEDIQIPANLDCSLVRDGKFETKKSLIERKGSKQIQINKEHGDKQEFIVEWANDCEYTLTLIGDSSEKLRVKITSINTDNYSCYVISENPTDRYANFVTVKRIK